MHKRNSLKGLVTILAVFTTIVIIIVLSIWYSVWQFQLCYPEVSTSFWYCFQHAFGN